MDPATSARTANAVDRAGGKQDPLVGRERERTTMARTRERRGANGVEERERDSQERRGRAGCYLSHHKAVITFSLPDRSLATLLVAPRSISG